MLRRRSAGDMSGLDEMRLHRMLATLATSYNQPEQGACRSWLPALSGDVSSSCMTTREWAVCAEVPKNFSTCPLVCRNELDP